MEVNSSMTIKKFLSGSLSSVMVLSCLNVGVAALEPNALDDATINQLKATAQNEIEHFSVRAMKTSIRLLASASMTVK